MPLNESKQESKPNISSILIKMGLVILALSFCAFLFFYYPVIIKEIMYILKKPNADNVVSIGNNQGEKEKKYIVATDKEFSIVIPKIGVNSKVVKDVDPYNSKEYQSQLTKGVAHAKGTALPGESGNSFYFAHSSDNFYNANRYNSVFYLLNKLSGDDLIYLIYNSTIYIYKVTQVKTVAPEEISYLKGISDESTVTLMTCWPAGTTYKRLVVVGELQK